MFSPWTPLPKHVAVLAERFDDSTFPSIPPGAAPLIPEFSVILGATEHLSQPAPRERFACVRLHSCERHLRKLISCFSLSCQLHQAVQVRSVVCAAYVMFVMLTPVARINLFFVFLLTWHSSFFSKTDMNQISKRHLLLSSSCNVQLWQRRRRMTQSETRGSIASVTISILFYKSWICYRTLQHLDSTFRAAMVCDSVGFGIDPILSA